MALVLESDWSQALGWTPSIQQQQQLQQIYQAILQGNQQLNLTRITEPSEFLEKHLWDSLRGVFPPLSASVTQPLSLIDVGTGAGFPGLPLALACPDWRVTLLDSTRKKVAFLEALAAELNLPVQSIAGRAEQVGQMAKYRASFDIATIRAVAAPAICAEYTLPLLKLGGTAILYRGQWQAEEHQALESAAGQLGGVIERVDAFATPQSQSVRHCVYLKKVQSTPPEFPRLAGIPSQKPL
ncbi:MAG: 16S rRNA (guanine(527)-N(7))-methyltransferase RsmG [Pegethrix bostrychoides GSE-TBD4-15B]|jgi:16S rRNA (guanine527-N7)-methyltransferase|uniref:Ribosomal RNA small subunit methyltransferase G n=1 Tax=Pegethrix bostrychoides GSE-TBD4-15B TaxID=2839662 RepID=A0A951PCU5_9CYAN|nr:16S rRNA (guanine(527)-N(7))-methyltransferase RsmG [Pegethrix bostrychoides GSE-TBD4-15B]